MVHRSGRTSLRSAAIEPLEARWLMSSVSPADIEQYMVELVNRARADPAAEAARLGIDLNEGLAPGTITAAAKQPLAINFNLTDSARTHSQWMLDNDVFSHTGAGGSDPGDRMAAAGYDFTGSWGWGENIAYRSQRPSVPAPYPTTTQEHADLFVDSGIAGRGHRTNMLSDSHKEVGVGIVAGDFQGYNALMTTEDFAYVSGNSFLTGVVYSDTVTADNFYTPGEGLAGVTITAVRASDGMSFPATTFSTGGYSLRVPAGTYTVTAAGGALASPIAYPAITVGSKNVKEDFVPGSPGPTPTPDPTPAPAPTPSPTATPSSLNGTIKGKLFDDRNDTAKQDKGDAPLGGGIVFLDANLNGTLDGDETSVVSLEDGSFIFTGLDVGSYRVTIAQSQGWRVTTATFTDVTIKNKKPVKAKSLGLTQKAFLGGSLFVDLDDDRTREQNEPGFRKAKVYLDANNDGVCQKNERVAKIDKDGNFGFRNLTAGNYVVRLVLKSGLTATTPVDGAALVTLSDNGAIDANTSFGITGAGTTRAARRK